MKQSKKNIMRIIVGCYMNYYNYSFCLVSRPKRSLSRVAIQPLTNEYNIKASTSVGRGIGKIIVTMARN